jgi:hypothetical protein
MAKRIAASGQARIVAEQGNNVESLDLDGQAPTLAALLRPMSPPRQIRRLDRES